jgi:membrane protein implicated in regulation of membrane protease activity
MIKPATHLASILLAAVSLAHLLRIVVGARVTVMDSVIPMWVSVVAFLVAGAVAIMLWREARRKG